MKKYFESNKTQLFKHEGFVVALEVDLLTGGYYAYGQVYDAPGAEQSLSEVKCHWRITNPASWGFRSRAEALKARTRIKREIVARIAAGDFEGDFFNYQ